MRRPSQHTARIQAVRTAAIQAAGHRVMTATMGTVGMKKASDIERMLAHIGDPDMRYIEFETPQEEVRARADWSLLDSATGGQRQRSGASQPVPAAAGSVAPGIATSGVVPPASPTGAVSPRPAYVERELTPAEVPEEPHPQQTGEARGQLQRVFAKLRGDTPPEPVRQEPPPARARETPLSQIFKRLS